MHINQFSFSNFDQQHNKRDNVCNVCKRFTHDTNLLMGNCNDWYETWCMIRPNRQECWELTVHMTSTLRWQHFWAWYMIEHIRWKWLGIKSTNLGMSTIVMRCNCNKMFVMVLPSRRQTYIYEGLTLANLNIVFWTSTKTSCISLNPLIYLLTISNWYSFKSCWRGIISNNARLIGYYKRTC